ncbi:MAG: hypothetical protein JRN21_05240 [Nitrososphaerota archaeon]|nr:hypothetical protein [Nitrososphaerota archaeon]
MSHRPRHRSRGSSRKLAALLALVLLSVTGFSNALVLVSFASGGGSNSYATITTQLPSVLSYAKEVGLTAPTANMSVSFVLPATNVKQLDEFLAQMNDPGSPYYHKYLTAQQYDTLFGPDAGELAQLQSYLAQYGITVTTGGQVSPGSVSLNPDQFVLQAHGSVSEFDQALKTQIQDYQYKGASFYSASSQAKLPDQFGNLLMIYGMDNWQSSGQAHGAVPLYRTLYQSYENPGQTPGNFFAYSPSEIAQSYNLTSLYNRNINGTGVTIAIVDAYGDPYIQDELNNFSQQFGIPTTSVNTICIDGPCNMTMGIVTGWNVEIALDVEWAHALAPGAKINLYIGSNNAQALYDAEEAAVNSYGSPTSNNIISNSWGIPENDIASSAAVAPVFGENYPWLDQVMQQAAAQGITVFAASGDWGAYDQAFGQTSPYGGAIYPSTDPYVTGVGGTTLYMNTTSGYLSPPFMNATGGYGTETAWSWNNLYGWGTGGGYSTLFSQPAWQSGPGVTANGARGAPDVAWDADVQTGVAVDVSCGKGMCGYIVGGTSVGSPSWAASMALIDQAAAHPLGYINPTLYSILNNPAEYAKAFHDVTVGNNNPYQAGTGWDPLTGIGSPNVGELSQILSKSGSSQLSVQAGLDLVGGSYGPSNPNVLVDESTGSAPDSLDPATAFYGQDVSYLNAVFQDLVEMNGTSGTQFVPALASSYTTGSNYTVFQIRSNVTFSDGSKLSAYDAWFSIARLLYENAPSGIAPFNWNQVLYNLTAGAPLGSGSYSFSSCGAAFPWGARNAIAAVTGEPANLDTQASCNIAVKFFDNMLSNFDPTNATYDSIMSYPSQALVAYNSSTFEAKYLGALGTFAPQFWSGFTGAQIVDPAYVDAHGGVQNNTENGWFNSNGGPGTGPYMVQSVGPGLTPIVLVANPNYWGSGDPSLKGTVLGQAMIPEVVISPWSNLSQAFNDFGTNQAQLSAAPISNWGNMYNGYLKDYFSFDQILRNLGPFDFALFLAMNSHALPLNIADFRKGVADALNYTALNAPNYFQGTPYGSEFLGPLVPGDGSSYNPGGLPIPAQNTTAAYDYFEAAGYQGNFYIEVPTTFTLSNGTSVLAGSSIGDSSGTLLASIPYYYVPPLQGNTYSTLQSSLGVFGINVTAVGVNSSYYGQLMSSPSTFPNFMGFGWGADFQYPFGESVFNPLMSPSPYNGYFDNSTVQAEVNACIFPPTPTAASTCDSTLYSMAAQNQIFVWTPIPNGTYIFAQPYVKGLFNNQWVGDWYNTMYYSPVALQSSSLIQNPAQSVPYGSTVEVTASVTAKGLSGSVTVGTGTVTATVTLPNGKPYVTGLPLSFNSTTGQWSGRFPVNSTAAPGEWSVTVDAVNGTQSGAGYATASVGDGVTVFSPLYPYWLPGQSVPVAAVVTAPDGTEVTSGTFTATFNLGTPSGPSEGSVPLSYQCGLNFSGAPGCMWVGTFNIPSNPGQGPWVMTVGGTDSSGNQGSAYFWLNVGLDVFPFTDSPSYVVGDPISIYASTGAMSGNFSAVVSGGGNVLGTVPLTFDFLTGLWSGTFQTVAGMPSGFYTVTVQGDTVNGYSGEFSTVVRVAPSSLTVTGSTSSARVSASANVGNGELISARLSYPNGAPVTTGSVAAEVSIGADGASFGGYYLQLTYDSATGTWVNPSEAPVLSQPYAVAGNYSVSIGGYDGAGDAGSGATSFFVTLPTHAPVSITNSSGFTSANGVVGGNGSASNPYVIAGLNTTSISLSGNYSSSYVIVDNWVQGSSGNGITLNTPYATSPMVVVDYALSNAGDGVFQNSSATVGSILSVGNGKDGFALLNFPPTGGSSALANDVALLNGKDGFGILGNDGTGVAVVNDQSYGNGANGIFVQDPQAVGAFVAGDIAVGNRLAGVNVTGADTGGPVYVFSNTASYDGAGIAVDGQGQNLNGPFPCPVASCSGVFLGSNMVYSDGVGVLATNNSVVLSQGDFALGNGVGFQADSSVVSVTGAVAFGNPDGGILLNQQAPGNTLVNFPPFYDKTGCNCNFTSVVAGSSAYFNGNATSGTGPGIGFTDEQGVLSFGNLAVFGGSDGFQYNNVNYSISAFDTSGANLGNGVALNGAQGGKVAISYAGGMSFGLCGPYVCVGPSLQVPGNGNDGFLLNASKFQGALSGFDVGFAGDQAAGNGNNGIEVTGSTGTNVFTGTQTFKNSNDGILVSGPGGNDTITAGMSAYNGMNGIELAGGTQGDKVFNYSAYGNGWACNPSAGCEQAAGVFITDSSNNTVQGGSIGGTGVASPAVGFGVAINGSSAAGNMISGSNIQNDEAGIGFIDTANNTATNNDIAYNQICIYLQNGANNNYANNNCNNDKVNVYSPPALDQSFVTLGTPAETVLAGSNYLNVTYSNQLLYNLPAIVFFEVDNATTGQEVQVVAVSLSLNSFGSGSVYLGVQTLAPGTYTITSFVTTLSDVPVSLSTTVTVVVG